jgi:hypothetical protein
MMQKWIWGLLALSLAGCASTSIAPLPAVAPTAPSTQIEPTLTPPTASTEAQFTLTPQASPATTETAVPNANRATPTTNTPPKIDAGVASPTALSPGGWKTYVNANWHVAVDYPPDWSARENATMVTFTAPTGAAIQLAPVGTGALSPEDFINNQDLPNTRCTSKANAHGINARVCFDTIAFSTDAEFIMRASNGPERLLSLSMGRRTGDPQVFDSMLASVRSLP